MGSRHDVLFVHQLATAVSFSGDISVTTYHSSGIQHADRRPGQQDRVLIRDDRAVSRRQQMRRGQPGIGVGVGDAGVTAIVGVGVGVAGTSGIKRARPMRNVSPGFMLLAFMIQSTCDLYRVGKPADGVALTRRCTSVRVVPGVAVGPGPPEGPATGISSSCPMLKPAVGAQVVGRDDVLDRRAVLRRDCGDRITGA